MDIELRIPGRERIARKLDRNDVDVQNPHFKEVAAVLSVRTVPLIY